MIRHDRRATVAPQIDVTHDKPNANAMGSHTSWSEYVATMDPATCDSRFCIATATPHTRYAMKVSVSDTDVITLTVRPNRSVSGGRFARRATTATPTMVSSHPPIATTHMKLPISAANAV